jgi:hypothetical protein
MDASHILSSSIFCGLLPMLDGKLINNNTIDISGSYVFKTIAFELKAYRKRAKAKRRV